jgi:hypothetical protein
MSDFKMEVEGSLVFDSWVNHCPALRDAASAENRHLIYEGQGVILDLLVRPMPGEQTLRMSGQILHGFGEMKSFDDVSNLAVSMEMETDGRAFSLRTNALGEFIFNGIPDGVWNLTIAFHERAFVVRRPSTQNSDSHAV